MKDRRLVIGIACFAAGLAAGVTGTRMLTPSQEPAAAEPLATKAAARPPHPTPANPSPADRSPRPAKPRQAVTVAQETRDEMQELVEGAMQLDDDRLREKSIENIHDAMASKDPARVAAALSAFNSLAELDFERSSFRPLITPHLEAEDPEVCRAAWWALFQTGAQPGDIEQLREVARDGGVGDAASILLFRFGKGDFTGESGDVILDLLAGAGEKDVKALLPGLWGARLSSGLEAEIIAMSREPGLLHDAVYFSLSTQQNKRAATVERLIEVLADRDSHNNGGRAAWGLLQGVPDELTPIVADAALKIVTTRSSGYLQQQAWALLNRYAGPAQREALEEFAAKPNLSEARRASLEAILRK
ncbi:hypothetical protein [Luteolibacter marinus]|uniref:hypothetical protein n=1 Tax=Luteolibacter marinus TaxID=2776705 RepID=UPI0018660963|nr:hypothetical protein [Luteolibacter marinus]